MRKAASFLIVVFVLAGCGESTSVQTVDWYKANKPERLAMLTKCNANPGELATSPNCVNAKVAQNQVTFGSRDYRIDATPPTFSKKEK